MSQITEEMEGMEDNHTEVKREPSEHSSIVYNRSASPFSIVSTSEDESIDRSSVFRPFQPPAPPAAPSRTPALGTTNSADFWYITEEKWQSLINETALPANAQAAIGVLQKDDQAGRAMETDEGALAEVPCQTCADKNAACTMFANGKYKTCVICKRLAKGGCDARVSASSAPTYTAGQTGVVPRASASHSYAPRKKRGRPPKHESRSVEQRLLKLEQELAASKRQRDEDERRLENLEEEAAITQSRLERYERTGAGRLVNGGGEGSSTKKRKLDEGERRGQRHHSCSCPAVYLELREVCACCDYVKIQWQQDPQGNAR
ncbi:uncharacterized protein LTR77_010051 [Saxophila tyrrhenica]|uniref:Zn(2)-C6 fungal-type domain-containing protein n=1 Tax=Saxophila tyrrhenica TaxID=1690608 RepID=A0AAV9P0J1_9PEZI|nr:hypothetical protein LTR77_010051 [Saxophila tyrrhenica]